MLNCLCSRLCIVHFYVNVIGENIGKTILTRKYCKKIQYVVVKIVKIKQQNKVLLTEKLTPSGHTRNYSLNLFSFRKLNFLQYFLIKRGQFNSRILFSYWHSNFLAQLLNQYCFQAELSHFKVYLHKCSNSLDILRVLKFDFELSLTFLLMNLMH